MSKPVYALIAAAALLSARCIPSRHSTARPLPHAQVTPPAPYQAVNKLVKLPDFLPGMGHFSSIRHLAAGPFGHDHEGKLVSTIYMVPLSAMKADMNAGQPEGRQQES